MLHNSLPQHFVFSLYKPHDKAKDLHKSILRQFVDKIRNFFSFYFINSFFYILRCLIFKEQKHRQKIFCSRLVNDTNDFFFSFSYDRFVVKIER